MDEQAREILTILSEINSFTLSLDAIDAMTGPECSKHLEAEGYTWKGAAWVLNTPDEPLPFTDWLGIDVEVF